MSEEEAGCSGKLVPINTLQSINRANGSSDYISVEVMWFKMSARTTAVLTEVFCALPQSLRVNTRLEPKFNIRSVSSVYLQNALFATTELQLSPVPGLPGN